jgi:N-acyl-D-amino-acid deacylase
MQGIVREALQAGAMGFATSKASTHVGYQGRPVPSRAASFDEISALAGEIKTVGRGGVIQATVGRGLSFDEFAKLNKLTGATVSWTALLAGIALNQGMSAHDQLERSSALIKEGYNVVPQVSPRALSFEYQLKAPFVLESMRMFKPVSEADFEGKKKIYRDADFRRRLWEKLDKGVPATFRNSFLATVVSEVKSKPELNERRIADIAAESGRTPVEVLFDLGLETELEARFRAPVANHDEDEVEELLRSPDTVIGLSDAGAHASQLCDACATTYMLRRWVREKKVLGLERAVQMLTSRPAEVFGITDRGKLQAGLAADVVIFNPDVVSDGPLKRVYDFPSGADRLISEASGIDAVVVNGQLLRQHNEDVLDANGDLPGRLLRNGSA